MTVATGVERLLVVDDHRVFTDLLCLALGTDDGFDCIATASSIAEARAAAHDHEFDVAVVDVQLPDGDGMTLAQEFLTLEPRPRVVMLTAFPRPDLIARAAAIGASGMLAKNGSLADLLAALRKATPDAPAVTPLPRPDHPLTPRELDVLRLLGTGNDARAIARLLSISPHTTRDHVKSILAKLGATSQLDAVVMASRAGIIHIGRR